MFVPQPSRAGCGLVGTTMTVGPSACSAALNSWASLSVPSTSTARHPKPAAIEAMSRPGSSNPGTPGVFSSAANDFSTEYSPLRITTNTIGKRCWAAVQMACTEYWNDPSPMVATTVRLTPRARSPSATPTAPGTPQPIPPLAVAKNDAGRVVGSQRSCSAIVEVDSITTAASAGLTSASVDQTASVLNGANSPRSTLTVGVWAAGSCRSL